jgi:hypothetical protein
MGGKEMDNPRIEGEEESVKVKGTPTLMMLPARNYTFKVYEGEFVITVPRKGHYKDLDDRVFTEEDGDFNILQYNEQAKGEVLFIPAISKILFATSQYPDLTNDQAFTPIVLIIKEDTVDIIGNIIQMVKEN